MRTKSSTIAQELEDEAAEWKTKAREARIAAMDATRAAYDQLQEKTIAYTKATDQAIRNHTYASLGIAFGAGMLLGLILKRRNGQAETE